jgi:hypothetical protein
MHDSFDVEKHIRTDFQSFKGLLRLSGKYQFPHIRNVLESYLFSCFPPTLSGFLDERNRCKALDGLEVAVVNLAREEKLLQVLPAAMYAIATRGPEDLFVRGLEIPSGNWVRLERADEIHVLLARGKMHRFLYDILSLHDHRKGCPLYATTRRAHTVGTFVPIEAGEIGPSHGNLWPEGLKCTLGCGSELDLQSEGSRKKAWALLPGWLGLGSWQDLERSGTSVTTTIIP